ncbi:MAG TPA: hypothetical protein VMB66_13840 [Candidatus Acidoferrales bacterium]|nr:hypothetical protein [Candidatus Acidoferrales bacterium]
MVRVLPRRLSTPVVALTVDCKLFRGCRFANTKANPDDAHAGNSLAQSLFITQRKHQTLEGRFVPSAFDH